MDKKFFENSKVVIVRRNRILSKVIEDHLNDGNKSDDTVNIIFKVRDKERTQVYFERSGETIFIGRVYLLIEKEGKYNIVSHDEENDDVIENLDMFGKKEKYAVLGDEIYYKTLDSMFIDESYYSKTNDQVKKFKKEIDYSKNDYRIKFGSEPINLNVVNDFSKLKFFLKENEYDDNFNKLVKSLTLSNDDSSNEPQITVERISQLLNKEKLINICQSNELVLDFETISDESFNDYIDCPTKVVYLPNDSNDKSIDDSESECSKDKEQSEDEDKNIRMMKRYRFQSLISRLNILNHDDYENLDLLKKKKIDDSINYMHDKDFDYNKMAEFYDSFLRGEESNIFSIFISIINEMIDGSIFVISSKLFDDQELDDMNRMLNGLKNINCMFIIA